MFLPTHRNVFRKTFRSLASPVGETSEALPLRFLDGARFRKSSTLRLLEFDGVKDLLELSAGVETRQDASDHVAAHGIGFVGSFRSASQPEVAEVAQFHDVPFAQFLRDDIEQGFEHGHCVGAADGGDGADLPGQLAQGHPAAGLDGRVELLGGLGVAGIAPFHNVELDGHIFLL